MYNFALAFVLCAVAYIIGDVVSTMYAIMMIGMTISLAGNPRIKAIRITPSNPISCANGSKKAAQ